MDPDDLVISVGILPDITKRVDVDTLQLSPEQLKSGQITVTLQWCDSQGIGNHMRAAIIKEIESVRKMDCFDLVSEDAPELDLSKAMTSILVLTLKIDTMI